MINFNQTPEQVLKTLETCNNAVACACLVIARHNVFDNKEWEKVIVKAQEKLRPKWEIEAEKRHAERGNAFMRTME